MPTTVWTTGPVADTQPWPPTIVARAVNEFSNAGDTVVLLPWPRPTIAATTASTTDQTGDPADHGDRDGGSSRPGAVALAATTVTAQARHVVTAAPPAPADQTHVGEYVSTPFWAAMIDPSPVHAPSAVPAEADTTASHARPQAAETDPRGTDGTVEVTDGSSGSGSAAADPGRAEPESGSADLVIAWAPPWHVEAHTADVFIASAARMLRTGGTLAVITHCDWNAGQLLDPSGVIVAAAQNADLLYLQHIAALHSSIEKAELQAPPSTPAGRDERDRAAHRATVRGLPVPHERSHSDVLAFAQPAYHASTASVLASHTCPHSSHGPAGPAKSAASPEDPR